jgi:hypothetical protein
MKPREFNQKLSLNKKTISHLNSEEKSKIAGGLTPRCHTWGIISCGDDCNSIWPNVCK